MLERTSALGSSAAGNHLREQRLTTRAMRWLGLTVLLVLAGIPLSLAQWRERVLDVRPPAVVDGQSVYDESRGVVVFFGGMLENGQHLNETWEYDGRGWTKIETEHSPSPRRAHGMAYDANRQVVVLFGGYGGQKYDDTWEYDGTDWHQVDTASAPQPTWQMALAYDRRRQVVVLFGGLETGDVTWEYDGSDWNPMVTSTAPPARKGCTLAWCEERGTILMFGGSTSGSVHGNLNDTWEYDGTQWVELHPEHRPGFRGGHEMVGIDQHHRVLLFGGREGAGGDFLDDMWVFHDGDWHFVDETTRPEPRDLFGFAYDAQRDVLVLNAGRGESGYVDDTWEYGPLRPRWLQQSPDGNPPSVVDAEAVFDEGRGVVVAFGGMDSFNNHLAETWEYDGHGWYKVETPTSPPARRAHGMAYDTTRGVVVMFGGYDGRDKLADTWEYDGIDWRRVDTPKSPPATWQFGMAYDRRRGRVVLYGGIDVGTTTWEYDGVTWEEKTLSPSPSVRKGCSMAWHAGRETVLLYGGATAIGHHGELEDTWEYDGVEWRELAVEHRPPRRDGHGMVGLEATKEVLLYGGYGPGVGRTDTWSFYGGDWHLLAEDDGPGPRDLFCLAADPTRQVVILEGGRDIPSRVYKNDTWEYGPLRCGDGHMDMFEECDDGNRVDGDGCDALCRRECSAEVCNGLDDDCDGVVGPEETDDDGDGYVECSPWEGDVPGIVGGGDCDDTRSDVNPGAAEVTCDGLDQNCSGMGDESPDRDGDGFDVCDPADPYDGDGLAADCDDANPERNPGATEVCNDVDDDCDALIDEDELGEDTDGDGVRNLCDNCREVYNADQSDRDGDGLGNACDNCVDVWNPGQENRDGDSRGDACDNCPETHSENYDDGDEDGVGDVCDNCPDRANESQHDGDDDGEGDECDLDDGLTLFVRIKKVRLRWQEDPEWAWYNLYRGSLGVLLAGGGCSQEPGSNPYAAHFCDLASTVFDDPLEPAVGEGLYWLVAGENSGGEETLGHGAGVERENTSPCP